jgi:hypothetical protein
MGFQKQSRLERIVKIAKISAAAMALSLVSTTEIGNSSPEAAQEASAHIWELGRAHQLLQDFPMSYEIPGIRHVYKFENPEANYLLVYFRMGNHVRERMSRSYRRQVIAVNDDAYRGFSYLQERYGLEDIYREAITDENWLEYCESIDSTEFTIGLGEIFNEMRRNRDSHMLPSRDVMERFDRQYRKQMTRLAYDAAIRLAVERDVCVLPAEDAELHAKAGEMLESSWHDAETYDQAMNSLFRERELHSLREGVLLGNPIVVLFYGGMHARGFENSSLIRSIREHNADPENRYDQYCAVILTPDHYPEEF